MKDTFYMSETRITIAKHPLLRGNSEFGLGINPPRGSHADASRRAYLDLLGSRLEYLGPARASSIVYRNLKLT
jgi:hypothetical protein